MDKTFEGIAAVEQRCMDHV